MKYWSLDISDTYNEWNSFEEMMEYYKGFPKDRWKWGEL